ISALSKANWIFSAILMLEGVSTTLGGGADGRSARISIGAKVSCFTVNIAQPVAANSIMIVSRCMANAPSEKSYSKRIAIVYARASGRLFSPVRKGAGMRWSRHLLLASSSALLCSQAISQATAQAQSLVTHVRIETHAQNAKLYVDGEPRGSLPWEGTLPVGSHLVEVTAPGYHDRTQRVSLEAENKTRLIPVVLSRVGELTQEEREHLHRETQATVSHGAVPVF